jgi:O-antigen/teichoic acid export membrane protein
MKISNIVGFSLGPVISAVIGLVTVPIIAWLFNPEDIGRINIFHVAMTFGLLISMFGLDQAYVREYHEVEDKDQLLLICFLPGFIFLLLVGGVSLLYSNNIADFLYLQDNPVLYWLTISAVITMYITRFLSLILRMEERGWAYSLSQVVPKFLQLVLVAIVAISYLERDFTLLLVITFLSMIFVRHCVIGTT